MTIAVPPHGGDRPVGLFPYAFRMGYEVVPGGRGRGSPSDSIHETHTAAGLELPNLQAHSRLSEIELARRRRETSSLDDLYKCSKLINAEAAHAKETLLGRFEGPIE
jgi:hypothetical protein